MIVHDADARAWRHDAIALGEPRPRDDGTIMVPVCDEYDFYRAQRESTPPYETLIPTGQLWVDRIWLDHDKVPAHLRTPKPDMPPGAPDRMTQHGYYVDPVRPPIRQMSRANKTPKLHVGLRCAVQYSATDFVQGLRLISEPYLTETGIANIDEGLDKLDYPHVGGVVTVCDERDYFSWIATGETPPSARWEGIGRILLE